MHTACICVHEIEFIQSSLEAWFGKRNNCEFSERVRVQTVRLLKRTNELKTIQTMTWGSYYIHLFMVLNILYQLSYNTRRKFLIRDRKCKYLTVPSKHWKNKPYVIDTWLTSITYKRSISLNFLCFNHFLNIHVTHW